MSGARTAKQAAENAAAVEFGALSKDVMDEFNALITRTQKAFPAGAETAIRAATAIANFVRD